MPSLLLYRGIFTMRIGGLQKFSLSDFPGTPAAILFTQGCNFRCPFCHNGSLLPLHNPEELAIADVLVWLESRVGKLDGVVITGGEPCIHDDLPEFIAEIKAMGFRVKLDSNGSRPEMLKRLIDRELLDYIAMDIKTGWDNYERLCGVPVVIADVKKSIETIVDSSIPHLFRTTYVDALMKEEEFEEIKTYIPASSQYIIQEFRKETALDKSLR